MKPTLSYNYLNYKDSCSTCEAEKSCCWKILIWRMLSMRSTLKIWINCRLSSRRISIWIILSKSWNLNGIKLLILADREWIHYYFTYTITYIYIKSVIILVSETWTKVPFLKMLTVTVLGFCLKKQAKRLHVKDAQTKVNAQVELCKSIPQLLKFRKSSRLLSMLF